MNIFLDDEDFHFFILRLRQNLFPDKSNSGRIILLPPDSFSVISYCLMPNHYHLLLRQNGDIPTSKLIAKICTSYSKYFNKKYKRLGQGHVFQDKFKQILIDDNSYLVWLSAYIHQNPKVAGLVGDASEYGWSSYADFLNLRNDPLCDKSIILNQFKNRGEYGKFVEDSYGNIKNNKEIEHFLLDYTDDDPD